MSAIALPFIDSTTAINSDTLIPVEKIISMDKQTIVDPNSATNNLYAIVFVVDTLNSAPKEAILKYVDSATRNTAFADIKVAISTPV